MSLIPFIQKFSDDFTTDKKWKRFANERYRYGIAQGDIYKMEFFQNDSDWLYVPQPHRFVLTPKDVYIRVEGGASSINGAYGIVCRAKSKDNLYGFHIALGGNTNYWLFKCVAGASITLKKGCSAAITADINTIEMWCRGNTLKASVNNYTVVEYKDNTFSQGNVGLFAQPFGAPFSAYINEFSVEVSK